MDLNNKRDSDFVKKIIVESCEFAVANGIEPDDCLVFLYQTISDILDEVSLNDWGIGNG